MFVELLLLMIVILVAICIGAALWWFCALTEAAVSDYQSFGNKAQLIFMTCVWVFIILLVAAIGEMYL